MNPSAPSKAPLIFCVKFNHFCLSSPTGLNGSDFVSKVHAPYGLFIIVIVSNLLTHRIGFLIIITAIEQRLYYIALIHVCHYNLNNINIFSRLHRPSYMEICVHCMGW